MKHIKDIWTDYQKQVVQEVCNTQSALLELRLNEETGEYEVTDNMSHETVSLNDFYWKLCIPFYG